MSVLSADTCFSLFASGNRNDTISSTTSTLPSISSGGTSSLLSVEVCVSSEEDYFIFFGFVVVLLPLGIAFNFWDESSGRSSPLVD